MRARQSNEYYQLLHLAGNYLSEIVRFYLQDGASKEFMLWILNNQNQHQENYLRMLGIAGSIELELKLLSNVIDYPIAVSPLGKFISILNSYFGYETLSDNLGVGLAPSKRQGNKNYLRQKKVLLYFNKMMIQSIIASRQKDLYTLFKPITSLLKDISVHQQTLFPEQMQFFTKSYHQAFTSYPRADLEHTFLEILILNIATCLGLLNSLSQSAIYNLLKKSLIARYSSVSLIVVRSSHATYRDLSRWGLHAILTIPTLAYCIGALEEVSPHPGFKTAIANGLLYEVMAEGALLTRLLNDVGTRLLVLNAKERKTLYHAFQDCLGISHFDSIFAYLSALCEQEAFSCLLTRIRKDLKHGEFNICLDQLNEDRPLQEEMTKFCHSIDYFAEEYQTHSKIMADKLLALKEIMGDAQASNIINNFVEFHRMKYSREFESMLGDYAITRQPNNP